MIFYYTVARDGTTDLPFIDRTEAYQRLNYLNQTDGETKWRIEQDDNPDVFEFYRSQVRSWT